MICVSRARASSLLPCLPLSIPLCTLMVCLCEARFALRKVSSVTQHAPLHACHGLATMGTSMGYPPKLIPSLPGLGLHPKRVQHDPMITAGVVVAASIALQSQVQGFF